MVQTTPEEIIAGYLNWRDHDSEGNDYLAMAIVRVLKAAGYRIIHESEERMPVLPIKPAKVDLPRGGEE